MIHSARPKVPPVVIASHLKIIQFCEIMKSGDGRSYSDHYRSLLRVGRVDQNIYFNENRPGWIVPSFSGFLSFSSSCSTRNFSLFWRTKIQPEKRDAKWKRRWAKKFGYHLTYTHTADQQQVFPQTRGVDVNKRSVTTHSCSLLYSIRFGHFMSSCLYLSLLLATSWPKLRFAIKCMF